MHITVIGNANVDLIIGEVEAWPQVGTEVEIASSQLRIGGALGNTASALHALGAEASFVTNVGADEFGAWLTRELQAVGCETVQSAAPTALTVGITHPNSQRTFFSSLGHLATFEVKRMFAALERLVAGDLLLLCGYFLLPTVRPYAKDLLRTAQAKGVFTVLDTGWPLSDWQEVRQEVFALLPHCDLFTPNREELCALLGKHSWEQSLSDLTQRIDGRTVVKLGKAGAAWFADDVLRTQSAPQVKVSDTVGAGDSFNAGLIYGLQRSLSWEDCVELAVTVASLTVASLPRRYPTAEELSNVFAIKTI